VSLSQIEGVKLLGGGGSKRTVFEVMSQGAVHGFAAESDREAQQWADALLRARAQLQATAATCASPAPASLTLTPVTSRNAPSPYTSPLASSGHLAPPSRKSINFGRIISSDGMSQLSSQASWSGASSSTDSKCTPSTGTPSPATVPRHTPRLSSRSC
jgi:hypothetical protein